MKKNTKTKKLNYKTKKLNDKTKKLNYKTKKLNYKTKKLNYKKYNTQKHHTQKHNTQSPTRQSNLIIGCHSSIANGIIESIKYVESIGGNAVQIFLGNNRSSSLKAKHKFANQTEINEINKYIKTNKIIFIIHSIYLLNFCSYPSNSNRIKYMHENIQYDLKYGNMIGAKCVILHLGFKKNLTFEIALSNMIDNINHIITNMPTGIILSLETSACRGSEFGCNLEELAQVWKGIKHWGNKKIGICIDTAHIFVSGYDISNIDGIKAYIKTFDSLIGIKYITNFHINDSKFKLGSRKDKHMGIGKGLIYNSDKGKEVLKYIKQLCILHKIPMILETHGAGRKNTDDTDNTDNTNSSYKNDIKLIKQE